MSDVSRLIRKIEDGDSQASEELLPLVYDELRRLAAHRLSLEMPGQTLQATALVHEAYLRLLGGDSDEGWDSTGHFFAAAAESMRRILVDRARKKKAKKHGGDLRRVELPEVGALDEEPAEELLALDLALQRLEEKDAAKARLVKLRYFAGMTVPQAAEILGIAVSTAEKHWTFAKFWLRTETRRITEKEL